MLSNACSNVGAFSGSTTFHDLSFICSYVHIPVLFGSVTMYFTTPPSYLVGDASLPGPGVYPSAPSRSSPPAVQTSETASPPSASYSGSLSLYSSLPFLRWRRVGSNQPLAGEPLASHPLLSRIARSLYVHSVSKSTPSGDGGHRRRRARHARAGRDGGLEFPICD